MVENFNDEKGKRKSQNDKLFRYNPLRTNYIFFKKMEIKIEKGWNGRLQKVFDSAGFQTLIQFVKSEYQHKKIYPTGKNIFSAFDLCSFDDVKVVIIGQDPYHGPNQAHGLCFSVLPGVPIPPSLKNIFKEILDDLGKPLPDNGDLTRWANQGVLLLNATLTVQAATAGSHQGKGWKEFTDAAIQVLSDEKENVAFLLWGAYAQKKGAIIDRSRHLVLESAHPSPFAVYRGFFGNRHFSKTNEYLAAKGKTLIEW